MVCAALFGTWVSALAQETTVAGEDTRAPLTRWTFAHRLELRANYRDSQNDQFTVRVRPPFSPQPFVERTVDPGNHVELSVLSVQLDMSYGTWFTARAKVHAVDKYRRNPTSTDRDIDADELFVRIGDKPEFLERPEKTSFFAQIGKAPRMERQPVRLLESYGITATAFNRFEDTQLLVGGSVGRNLYWRLQAANGNPVFFRDTNALAGDNGTPGQITGGRSEYGSGFPILYNAETESLFFETDNIQLGQGLGYRWQREDRTLGFDVLLFHYQRDLADRVGLTGTIYGGDLDLLDGVAGFSLPIRGRDKEEYGGRAYVEWHGLTVNANYTKQRLAGLFRQGYELETGFQIPLRAGPLRFIQPAARVSGITNHFRGRTFLAPSVGWPWTKIDAGVRIGFARNVDLTIERAKHNIGSSEKIDIDETLVTLRVRM